MGNIYWPWVLLNQERICKFPCVPICSCHTNSQAISFGTGGHERLAHFGAGTANCPFGTRSVNSPDRLFAAAKNWQWSFLGIDPDYPSIYEGFGLPPLKQWLWCAGHLLRTVSSLPEVGAILFAHQSS